ncbi:unnamed protein product [Knipowitschia caucasica]
MDRLEVQKKIKSRELSLHLEGEPVHVGKSDVWQHFHFVVDKDKVSVGFVQCRHCHALLAFETKKTGTSSLIRHTKACRQKRQDEATKSQQQTPMTSFITVPKVPQRLKQAITDKCVDFCTKDLRPFYTVSGEGFQALAQELINIGASYGRIAASSVLPHHGTISKACLEKAEMKREQLVSELKQTLASGDIGMSTDMWTDDYRKMSYIAITCQFINSDFLLVGKTLTTAVFPAEDAKTGKNIRRELLRLLINKFGLELSSLKNIVWVTDQGSNIIKALEPYRRLSCLDHLLNTVMRQGLDANNLTQNAPDISETITAAKSLVRHVKQSGLAAQLSKTVLQWRPDSARYILPSSQCWMCSRS